jgi:hypothetical protein
MKKKALILSACFLILLLTATAWGASDVKTLDIHAQVDAVAILTLGQTDIHFPATTPPTQFTATENPVTVRCQVLIDLTQADLSVICDGNLISGANNIPITAVTWTVTGAGYQAGTMSSTVDQTAGTWAISGDYSGTFSFFLANSWTYHTGTYLARATYTLTAP